MMALSSFESNGDLSHSGAWVRSEPYLPRGLRTWAGETKSSASFVKLALCSKETGDVLLSLTREVDVRVIVILDDDKGRLPVRCSWPCKVDLMLQEGPVLTQHHVRP